MALTLAIGSLAAGSSASFIWNWQRFYDMGSQAGFRHVAVDASNNVFVSGSFSGIDSDAIVVRYGLLGGVYWTRKFAGSGNQGLSTDLHVTSDGQLFVSYSRDNSFSVAELDPATGAVMWTKHFNAPAGTRYIHDRFAIEDPQGTAKTLHVPFVSKILATGAQQLVDWRIDDAGAATQTSSSAIGNDDQILDLAAWTGHGYYYLVGDPLAPGATAIRGFHSNGSSHFTTGVPNTNVIAFSPVGQGAVFAAGGYAGNRIKLGRVNATNGALSYSIDNVLSSTIDINITDLTTDAAGNLYVCGYETLPYSWIKKEWFLARYSYPNFNRVWRTPRPATNNDEVFRCVVLDGGGNLGVAGDIDNGRTDSSHFKWLTFRAYDPANGTLIASMVGNIVPRQFSDLAANAAGAYAFAGRQEYGSSRGVAWYITQNGLRSLTVPNPTYVGGSTVPVTITMYSPYSQDRSVALSSSDSTYAPVPASATVPGGSIRTTVNCVTLPTVVDRPITLTATFDLATRTTTFTLRPPASARG